MMRNIQHVNKTNLVDQANYTTTPQFLYIKKKEDTLTKSNGENTSWERATENHFIVVVYEK